MSAPLRETQAPNDPGLSTDIKAIAAAVNDLHHKVRVFHVSAGFGSPDLNVAQGVNAGGVYRVTGASSYVNRPLAGVNQPGILKVYVTDEATPTTVQQFTYDPTGRTFTRNYWTTWSAWVEVGA